MKKLHEALPNDVLQTMAIAKQNVSTVYNKEIIVNNLDTIYTKTRTTSRESNIIEIGNCLNPI
jgi:hypothetical protein